MKRHRDVKDNPTDPAEIKREIEWLMDHPLWQHDIQLPIVKDGDTMEHGVTGILEKIRLDTWPTETVRAGGSFYDCVNLEFVYVNPKNETIEEDAIPCTAFRVWIEAGGYYDLSTEDDAIAPEEGWNQWNRYMHSHDLLLDCGAATLPEALCALAALVRYFYTDEGEERKELRNQCEWVFPEEDEDGKPTCVDAGDGYCKVCGFEVD